MKEYIPRFQALALKTQEEQRGRFSYYPGMNHKWMSSLQDARTYMNDKINLEKTQRVEGLR